MKKLQKIKLDELAGIDLNERGLCRILGGGTPGNCQCGCLYAGAGGGSETGDNYDANVAGGHYSTTCPPAQDQCTCPPPQTLCVSSCEPPKPVQDALPGCGGHGGGLY